MLVYAIVVWSNASLRFRPESFSVEIEDVRSNQSIATLNRPACGRDGGPTLVFLSCPVVSTTNRTRFASNVCIRAISNLVGATLGVPEMLKADSVPSSRFHSLQLLALSKGLRRRFGHLRP